jgi:hypothetical protein
MTLWTWHSYAAIKVLMIGTADAIKRRPAEAASTTGAKLLS